MVVVAQLVRALDCGSRGRGFKSHHPPKQKTQLTRIQLIGFFIYKKTIPFSKFAGYSVGRSSGSEMFPFFSSAYQAPIIRANTNTIETYKAFGIGGGSPAP